MGNVEKGKRKTILKNNNKIKNWTFKNQNSYADEKISGQQNINYTKI